MQLPALLMAALGGLICLLFALYLALDAWVARRQQRFRFSSDFAALGLPALVGLDDVEKRRRIIQEFRDIRASAREHAKELERVRRSFRLSTGLRIRTSDGRWCQVSYQFGAVDCDVVLGVSLAGAGLTPGTAVYSIRVSAEPIAQAVAADSQFLKDLADGKTRRIVSESADISIDRDGISIVSKNVNGLGTIEMRRGVPILLSLDDASERMLRESDPDDAPPPGTSKKVRLFGGFEIDPDDGTIFIIPFRQEPSAPNPTPGPSLHPISSLLGVVIGEVRDKAFKWEGPSRAAMQIAA